MAVTIIEALENAKHNIKTGKKLPPVLDLAIDQLNNAIVLLEKGYSIEDEVEPLLEKYNDVESVPSKEEMLVISKEKLDYYIQKDNLAEALLQAGVDNWSGYAEAMKIYESYKQ